MSPRKKGAEPLARERIVDTALGIIDAEGLDALKASSKVERIIEDRANRIVADQWLSTLPASHGGRHASAIRAMRCSPERECAVGPTWAGREDRRCRRR